MSLSNWKIFSNHVHEMQSYWQIMHKFRTWTSNLPTGRLLDFVNMAFLAMRDKLILSISNVISSCEAICRSVGVDPNSVPSLKKLKDKYELLDNQNRDQCEFDGCGIKVFRDKLIAHPVGLKKALEGKELKVNMEWAVVDETVELIKDFCKEMEELKRPDWNHGTYWEEVSGVDVCFEALRRTIEFSDRYQELSMELAHKGACKVDLVGGPRGDIQIVE